MCLYYNIVIEVTAYFLSGKQLKYQFLQNYTLPIFQTELTFCSALFLVSASIQVSSSKVCIKTSRISAIISSTWNKHQNVTNPQSKMVGNAVQSFSLPKPDRHCPAGRCAFDGIIVFVPTPKMGFFTPGFPWWLQSTKASVHAHFQEPSVWLKANRNNQLLLCTVIAGCELVLVSKSSSDCWCQPVLLLGCEDWLGHSPPMDLAQRAGRCLSPSSCAPAILTFHTVL